MHLKEIPRGFVADEMLRKLGRFLRIAGFDVIMPVGCDDREIASIAISQNRVLLTRDKDLANMKGPVTIRISSDRIREQMKELKETGFPEYIERATTRCPECGTILERIDNNDTISRMELPPKVKDTQDIIYICRGCSNKYWRGRHWENIMEVLGSVSLDPLPYR